VIGIFRKNDQILVFESYDHHKDQTFYRPLGGGIDYGEYSDQALIREMREELQVEITNLAYLGTLENVFIHDGDSGHEIVIIYQADFADSTLYDKAELVGYEDDGTPFKALWKSLADFRPGVVPLYPDGLPALLRGDYRGSVPE
jgi:8-oxo-dGTP pyrophosphatase MutT (NUDIX family)